MAGFRTFATGEVLTAANVNDFLMEQTTMTFADAAARDTALAGILRAGLNVYLEDTDRLQYYDGTAWENVPNEADVDAAGGLVAVKSVTLTTTLTASVASGGSAAITGLTIAHSVADAANSVVLYAVVNGASDNQTARVNFGAAITAGGALLNLGNADGSRVRTASAASGALNANPQVGLDGLSLLAVHTPGVTTSVTYGVNLISVHNGTQTLFVNRGNGDSNDATNGRASCVLVLAEVKV